MIVEEANYQVADNVEEPEEQDIVPKTDQNAAVRCFRCKYFEA